MLQKYTQACNSRVTRTWHIEAGIIFEKLAKKKPSKKKRKRKRTQMKERKMRG